MGAIQQLYAGGSYGAKPGAPTIGTATSTGTTTATVSFTAPASNGGVPITSYTATSSPGGITGTLNQAGSGTITVSGLSPATAYTFTVTATNAIGTSVASAASNSITTVPVIGQAFGGGYFAGQISTSANGVATHNLIVSDKSVGETTGKQWGPIGTTTGVSSMINGPANSASLAALGAAYEAATFCEGLSSGGYTDWYLPASEELEVLYYFLKPNTANSNGGYSTSAYAVSPEPASTVYSPSAPLQTAATSFRWGAGLQELAASTSVGLWASNETAADNAYNIYLPDGSRYGGTKTQKTNFYARAVRRVPV